jgi:hypothetical protein
MEDSNHVEHRHRQHYSRAGKEAAMRKRIKAA